jgi:hypothetical protein
MATLKLFPYRNVFERMSQWRRVEKDMAGGFEARASGILGREFALSVKGGEFGRMESEGLSGAVMHLDGVEARVKRDGRRGYRMSSGVEELIEVRLPQPTSPVIIAGDGRYEGNLSLLRNRASAYLGGGGKALRLNGSLTGRAYGVEMEEGTLPAALFLLYYLTELRRRVFRARV